MAAKHKVTLIPGDGIGLECTQATQRLLAAAGAPLEWETCLAGAEIFRKGDLTGVPRETIDSIARNKVALKGPLETPVGYGAKSANVTHRKLFELYGNVRPTRELPGVAAAFAGRAIDLVVVRENVEDLYAGIEHMQTPGVAQCLKLISRKGCEKIVRLAFELARAEGRKKVHCATKANIMKMTEGLLKRSFEEIATEYSDIQAQHIIIDNCAHQLVRRPEQFDVIVTTNMNGDIISDLAAGLCGGLGLASSANIGNGVAIFEAVHGSAPDIAGKGLANPTALMLSAVMMLRHLGLFETADKVEQAILVTLEEGECLTGDLAHSMDAAATTDRYTERLIANLGRKSTHPARRDYKPIKLPEISREPAFVKARKRELVGVDLFVEANVSPEQLGPSLEKACEKSALRLKMISNRGVKVYPGAAATIDCVDHFRCRFVRRDKSQPITNHQLAELVDLVGEGHVWMHIEKLNEFDDVEGFSKAQGED
jgi:isocitrate dehydrogenase